MADVSQIKLPNGDTFDLVDEKSGYITAQYIENKTDYSIPVSRVGEIVVGETAIGTDSTNFPTSKAVVDYVDERVVQEIDAIDVGVTGIKANGTSLSVVDGVVNIPAIGPNQSVGLMTDQWMQQIWNRLNSIPTFTSQLTNDSGFITSYTETDPTVPDWAKAATKPTYTAAEVGALPSDTTIIDEKLKTTAGLVQNTAYYLILGENSTTASTKRIDEALYFRQGNNGSCRLTIGDSTNSYSSIRLYNGSPVTITPDTITAARSLVLPDKTGTIALTTDIPTVPTNISSFTNDSGYLTASDIASVMTYKGTKANYAALPSTGNTTGDVWHLTDTGAEWAWDGSAWQELGTAIDLSNYLTTSDIAAWAKASTKPTYTAAEVGALPDTTTIPSKTSDLTNDSGFITSYTDEKLKTNLVSDTKTYYPIFGNASSTAETKQYSNAFKFQQGNSASLTLGTQNDKNGIIQLWYGDYITYLQGNNGSTENHYVFLPAQQGTLALTSDIPKVYSSTNTGGYLTMATLPIYDGTVE